MTRKKESADLDALVTFYEPHPGFGGAVVPLPGPIKTVIDKLDGKTMTLRQGIEKIKAAGIGQLEILEDYGCIMLNLGEWPPKKAPCHTWMIIKYKRVLKEIIKPKKRRKK